MIVIKELQELLDLGELSKEEFSKGMKFMESHPDADIDAVLDHIIDLEEYYKLRFKYNGQIYTADEMLKLAIEDMILNDEYPKDDKLFPVFKSIIEKNRNQVDNNDE